MPVTRVPTISLRAATGLSEAMAAAGCEPDQILVPLGLSAEKLADPHGFIAAVDFAQILDAAARASGDDCFGLHFGERFQPRDNGALTYVVLNSPTFAVAFDNVARYIRVHNEAARFTFVAGQPTAQLRFGLDVPAGIRRQQVEYALAVALSTLRMMAGSQWAPIEVQLEHAAPARPAELIRVFGAPVSFGRGVNAFVVERAFAERPVPAADARLYPILRDYLEPILAEMPQADGLMVSVRRAIGETMRHGEPTLGQVAARLALGARTLQRRLKQENLAFKGLIDDTRRQFALRYLRDPANTLSEVSYLLGFSEVSAFNRAFRRWTGSTPSEYRRGLPRR
jgi:AraC-like DNA-binding protein